MGDSRGVFAPTIRFHGGIYYIINTCLACNGSKSKTNAGFDWFEYEESN